MRITEKTLFRGMLTLILVNAATRWAPDTFAAEDTKPARKPNIIVIVADDLGYGEVVCGGKQEIPTPRIQSIAQGGVCFTNGYVTCPVCSPTRAGLLTGRYQQRFGHEFNPGPPQQAADTFGLPLTEITLADRLKKLGYSTGLVGKWHLGYKSEFQPPRRGFDEFFGFLSGAHSYLDSAADKNNLIYRDDKPVEEPAYLTDALGREAVAFIDRHKQQPFFLFLTFNAVHAPLQTPEKYRSRFASISDDNRRTFAAMLSALDDNVGAVLDKLQQDKLTNETLIFFISDNGGPTSQTTSRNNPLRGFKGQVWEGGVRVPFMVSWKGHLPEGKTDDRPVSSLDIVPTALAAAGALPGSDHPLDGVDLLPYLTSANTTRPHQNLYWRYGQQWAIRKNDLKLLKPLQEPAQLYDLAADPGEQHNLAAEKPQEVEQLKKDYEQWNAQLTEPRWKGRQTAAGAKGKQRGKKKKL